MAADLIQAIREAEQLDTDRAWADYVHGLAAGDPTPESVQRLRQAMARLGKKPDDLPLDLGAIEGIRSNRQAIADGAGLAASLDLLERQAEEAESEARQSGAPAVAHTTARNRRAEAAALRRRIEAAEQAQRNLRAIECFHPEIARHMQ